MGRGIEYAVLEFVTYYHRERPHESLDGGMIERVEDDGWNFQRIKVQLDLP
jgi:hypothetical protein